MYNIQCVRARKFFPILFDRLTYLKYTLHQPPGEIRRYRGFGVYFFTLYDIYYDGYLEVGLCHYKIPELFIGNPADVAVQLGTEILIAQDIQFHYTGLWTRGNTHKLIIGYF